MKQLDEIVKACPVCSEPIALKDGKIPNHGRRIGVGIWPCGLGTPGFGFAREWAKEVKKEGKKK